MSADRIVRRRGAAGLRSRTSGVHATSRAAVAQAWCTLGLVSSVLVVGWRGLDRYELPKTLIQVPLLVVGLACAAVVGSLRWSRALSGFSVLVLALSVSSLLSSSPRTAFLGTESRQLGVVAWIMLGGVMLLGSAFVRIRPVVHLLVSVAASATIVAAVALAEIALAGSDGRPVSTLGTAMSAGMSLAVGLVVTLFLVVTVPGGRRPVVGVAALLQAAGLAATGSRGAWLGAAAGAVVVAMWMRRHLPRSLAIRVVAGGLAAFALVVALVPNVIDRAGTLTRPTEGTAGGRIALMSIGISAFSERPVLGWGADQGRPALQQNLTDGFEASFGDARIEDRVHNIVLDVAVWGGAVGLLAGLGFIVALVAGARRQRDELWMPAVGAALIAYGVHLCFNFPVVVADATPWLLMGAAAGPPGRIVRVPSWSASIGAALTLALVLPSMVDRIESDRRLADAADAEQGGDIVAAGRLYRQAVDAGGGTRSREVLARFALRSGDHRQALEAAMGAAAADPADPYLAELVVAALASLAAETGDTQMARRAIELASELVEAAPFDGSLWLVLGNAFGAAGDLMSSRDAYRRAVAITPSRFEAWRNLGVAELRLGDASAAREALRRALALRPDDPITANALDRLGG